jgi:hypothetical protein
MKDKLVGVACGYEAVALVTGKVPTISSLTRKYCQTETVTGRKNFILARRVALVLVFAYHILNSRKAL